MSLSDVLYDLSMAPLESLSLRRLRRRLIPMAAGRVLEVGAGTGVNVSYYRPERVDELHLLDRMAGEGLTAAAQKCTVPVHIHRADVLDLPFPDGTFDTVVFTLLFCSVTDPVRGLSEVRRVLAPGGRVLFFEHVRPVGKLGRLVDAIDPLWHKWNGDCHLNRNTAVAIHKAGFRMKQRIVPSGGLLMGGVVVPFGSPTGSPTG